MCWFSNGNTYFKVPRTQRSALQKCCGIRCLCCCCCCVNPSLAQKLLDRCCSNVRKTLTFGQNRCTQIYFGKIIKLTSVLAKILNFSISCSVYFWNIGLWASSGDLILAFWHKNYGHQFVSFRLGSIQKLLTQFYLNAAQPQLLCQFKQTITKICKLSSCFAPQTRVLKFCHKETPLSDN